MGAIAVFNFTAWATRYPEFAAVDPALAALYFTEAGLYFDNSGCGPVQDPNVQMMLMNMVTAHIASLAGALEPTGQPSGIVGRIKSASEGSTSVDTETGLLPGTAVWYQQTPYGLAFWQATKALWSARYVPRRGPCFDPYNPWGGYGWPR